MEIAQTIIQQLGRGTLMMLGAKNVVALDNGVQFSIQGCKEINKLVIKLDPSDTYTVEGWKVKRFDFNMVKEENGVYVDSLHRTIESMTNLRTSL